MIEAMLEELAEAGWTVSWAFQFEPNHWRVSIINSTESELKHCADAPTFYDALCGAWAASVEALEATEVTFSISKAGESRPSLRDLLNIPKPEPIKRRAL